MYLISNFSSSNSQCVLDHILPYYIICKPNSMFKFIAFEVGQKYPNGLLLLVRFSSAYPMDTTIPWGDGRGFGFGQW